MTETERTERKGRAEVMAVNLMSETHERHRSLCWPGTKFIVEKMLEFVDVEVRELTRERDYWKKVAEDWDSLR